MMNRNMPRLKTTNPTSVIISLSRFSFLLLPITPPFENSSASLPIGISCAKHVGSGRAMHAGAIHRFIKHDAETIGKICNRALGGFQFISYPTTAHFWVMLLYKFFMLSGMGIRISGSLAALGNTGTFIRAVLFSLLTCPVYFLRGEQIAAYRAMDQLQCPRFVSAGRRTKFKRIFTAWINFSFKWFLTILTGEAFYHSCLRFRYSEFRKWATARRTVLSAVHEAALAL